MIPLRLFKGYCMAIVDYYASNGIEETEDKFGSGKTYRWGKILWFKLDDKRPHRQGYIVVQDDHGQYCLGENIDTNSGVCRKNIDDFIYPQVDAPVRDPSAVWPGMINADQPIISLFLMNSSGRIGHHGEMVHAISL
jgi:hypothetical protein